MMFGFLDVSMTPKTSYLQFWRHQLPWKDTRKIPNHFGASYSWKYWDLGNQTFFKFWKRPGPKISKIRLMHFWKSWIWDPENMKWHLSYMWSAFMKTGILESLILRHLETLNFWSIDTLKLCKFETLKIWYFETLEIYNLQIWYVETSKL